MIADNSTTENDTVYRRYAHGSISTGQNDDVKKEAPDHSEYGQAASGTTYLDNEFSSSLERDDQQYDDEPQEEDRPDEDSQDDQELDPDDLDDDLVERYDENDREPDTFSDDGYKID